MTPLVCALVFPVELPNRQPENGLRVKTQSVKKIRKLLRRKQSSAKISKISGNTFKSIQSDIFYLLRNLLEISSANNFVLPRSFQKFLPFAFLLPSGCEGLTRHRPPVLHPRICLALPPQGSIWHRFNIDFPELTLFRCQIDP